MQGMLAVLWPKMAAILIIEKAKPLGNTQSGQIPSRQLDLSY